MQTKPQIRTDRLLPAPGQPSHSAARLLWFVVSPLILIVAGVFVFLSRQRQQHALQDQTHAALPIAVGVTHAKPGDATNELVLPATLQGLDEAPLYARVNGYVRGWYADIGKHVQKDQVLARIDSPEVDQQLIHTQATLSQAKANLVLAQTMAKRYQELRRGRNFWLFISSARNLSMPSPSAAAIPFARMDDTSLEANWEITLTVSVSLCNPFAQ